VESALEAAPSLSLLALPMPLAPLPQLTDRNVVPPNIASVDDWARPGVGVFGSIDDWR
jgi:hypothetical protein